VPHLDAWAGLWSRYDLSPGASLVSVQLADLKNQAARPPLVGGRYTSRTRVHHAIDDDGEASHRDVDPPATSGDEFRAVDSLSHIGASCSLPSVSSCGRQFAAVPSWACDWTYGRRFQGLQMGSPTTNVIATVLLSGPRAQAVVARFGELNEDSFLQPPHVALGLSGEAHVAVQRVMLPSETLFVARVGTEHREDMHRLLRYCLEPLEAELDVVPYARMLRASKTAARGGLLNLFSPPPFIHEAGDGANGAPVEEPALHVQFADVDA